MAEEKEIIWASIDFDAALFQEAFVSENEREYWEFQFKKGLASAFNLSGDNVNINVVIRGEGKELVVCLVTGNGLKDALNAFYNRAKNQGFKTVRFHVNKESKAKLFKKLHDGEGRKMKHVESIFRVVV